MIVMKVNSNLSDVVDHVNMININIQSIIVNAIDMAKEEIFQDLVNVFDVGSEDISIDFSFDGVNYSMTVDGINEYQLYNNKGLDMDFMLNFIENKILDRIQYDLDEAGYGHGN